MKIKDVYRQYNIDSDDLFSRYGKEKTIFKGLCSLMKIANKNNIGINKIGTPKKFIKELTKDKLDSVTDKDKKNALVLLGSSQYGVLTQRVGLRQVSKLSEDINEKKSDYEVFIDMLQINQKRILDLIYQDIPEDDFVVLLDELKDKMKPDIYEMLVSLNDHFKMIENKPHNKTKPVENALNDVQNKIDRLKDAYKRVDELEKIYNESFTTKKENICEEILRLQMNEINMLMKNTLELESKHSMAIEVKIEEPKVNRSFDSLKSQNDLSIKR